MTAIPDDARCIRLAQDHDELDIPSQVLCARYNLPKDTYNKALAHGRDLLGTDAPTPRRRTRRERNDEE